MNPDKTFTSKLGTTRAGERTRVWLEGARLVAHGFVVGARFRKAWNADDSALVLTVVSAAEEAAMIAKGDGWRPSDFATVSGKGAKPIIDITGARVADYWGKGSHVTVTYRPGRVTIKSAS